MSEYVLFTDSCADYDSKMVAELGIEVMNLTFQIGDSSYENKPDWAEMAPEVFYGRLRGGEVSSTSQINVSEFEAAFRKVLAEGKDVLYAGFSSALSGTLNSASVAADELRTEFKDRKIVVIDTQAASLGQGLLVWYAAKMKKEGKSLEEVGAWLEENKLKLAHWFTVDDLNFLKRGGRVSGASALLGTLLNIKPILHVDNAGKLIPVGKVRGRRTSLDTLLAHMKETAVNPADQTVFISHGDSLEDAQYLAEQIKKELGVKEIYINYVGPVIGSHSGPGTMALFFMATTRD